MVVDDDHIERKIGALGQGAPDRIGYCGRPVPDGDDYARLYGKVFPAGRRCPERRADPGIEALEVCRERGFHFLLNGFPTGIDIGKRILHAHPFPGGVEGLGETE